MSPRLPRGLAALAASPAGRAVLIAVGALALVTAIAMAVLWPGGDRGEIESGNVASSDGARVTSVAEGGCEQIAGPGCRLVGIELTSGSNEGRRSSFTLPDDAFAPEIEPGDEVRVARNVPSGIDPDLAEQLPLDDPTAQPYAFVDFERKAPLIWLAVVFAVIVGALGRGRGLASLAGLAASLALVLLFVIPAIVAGEAPLAVAVVGSLAVMLVTISLAHGLQAKSFAAMLGTAGSLLLVALLALFAVGVAHITGFSSEEATLLQAGTGGDIEPGGLVLAGMVIGALGVLDDLTVSQSSTVMALRRANPALGFRELFREAAEVGRDHISATVNTLVLAYVGASLPILLIFSVQGTSFGEAVNREPVAEAIAAGLVGSIGLIAAVPLTTALAALLATRIEGEALGDVHAHGHAH